MTTVSHPKQRPAWLILLSSWQFWLGAAVSSIALWLAFRGLDFTAAWKALSEANYWWVIPGVLAYMVAVWFRAWRWHYLLRPIKPVSTNTMFPIVTIGYMGNNLLPFRAGEVLRAYLLQRKTGISISASLATVIIERIFDGIVMLAFVVFNLNELTQVRSGAGFMGNIQNAALFGSALFGGALLAFLLTAMFPRPASRLYTRVLQTLLPTKLASKILNILNQFLEGLAALRSPVDALMIFLSTLLIWAFETVKYWFVMFAFNFHVTFFALMLMNGMANLATLLPGLPGDFGTFDASGIAVLVAYGVPQHIATSYTFALHIALWIVPTVLGLIFFLQTGLSFAKVREITEHPEQA